MDNKVIAAALAGLLRDVGKMEQRALTVPRKSAPVLRETRIGTPFFVLIFSNSRRPG